MAYIYLSEENAIFLYRFGIKMGLDKKKVQYICIYCHNLHSVIVYYAMFISY